MVRIEIDNLFVEDTFRTVFCNLTQKVSGVELQNPSSRKRKTSNPVSVVVLSKGAFKSKVIAIFPAAYIENVIKGMNSGELPPEDERDAYFKEYINMGYGRFISVINNEVGSASRFVIPVLLRGTYKEVIETAYSNCVDIDFVSDYGRIKVKVYYEVLPVHSSN